MLARLRSAFTQIIAILIITLCSLSSGIHYTWPTQAIPELVNSNVINLEEGSYFTVCSPVALVLAGPIFAILVDAIGRKKTVIVTAILQLVAWGFVSWGGSVWIYYAARVFSGAADAGYYTSVPVYMAEIATPKVRGTWGNLLTFNAYVGNLLSMILVYNFKIQPSAFICSTIPVVLLGAITMLPESPYYLIMKKKYEEATDALRWYRRCDNVADEFQQLVHDVNRQLSESGNIKDLIVIRSNRKAILIGAFLRGAQQFSGVSAVSIYAHYVFTDTGSNMSAIESTLTFTSLIMVSNICAAIFLDLIGRRRAMLISCGGCSVILLFIAVYFYLVLQVEIEMNQIMKLFLMVAMALYAFIYSIGLGIMPSLMLGELFSSSVKGKCLCLMNISFGICLAVSTKVFQLLMAYCGLHVAFAFLSICCVGNTVGSYFLVPDTQGKTLEEIQQTLKK